MEASGIRIYVLVFLILISGSCISSPEIDINEGASLEALSSQELLLRAYDDDLDSQFELGLRYEKGKGLSQSTKSSSYWYRTAAKRGHTEAQFRLGLYYIAFGNFLLKKGNIDESKRMYRYAVDWLEEAADSGHSRAQARIGDMKNKRE